MDLFLLQNDGQISDFVSFYTLPSTVMHHPTHKSLKAAYSFYSCSAKTPWVDLMQDALTVAKNVRLFLLIYYYYHNIFIGKVTSGKKKGHPTWKTVSRFTFQDVIYKKTLIYIYVISKLSTQTLWFKAKMTLDFIAFTWK